MEEALVSGSISLTFLDTQHLLLHYHKQLRNLLDVSFLRTCNPCAQCDAASGDQVAWHRRPLRCGFFFSLRFSSEGASIEWE